MDVLRLCGHPQLGLVRHLCAAMHDKPSVPTSALKGLLLSAWFAEAGASWRCSTTCLLHFPSGWSLSRTPNLNQSHVNLVHHCFGDVNVERRSKPHVIPVEHVSWKSKELRRFGVSRLKMRRSSQLSREHVWSVRVWNNERGNLNAMRRGDHEWF